MTDINDVWENEEEAPAGQLAAVPDTGQEEAPAEHPGGPAEEIVGPDLADTDQEDAEEPGLEAADPATEEPSSDDEAAPVSLLRGGRDFLVSASEAAQMVTERLQKKTTPATFRRMVIGGDAPEPEEEDDSPARWSQNTLDAWLDGLVAKAEAAVDGDDGTMVSPDGNDFYLSAAEAAALLSEALGEKISTAAFRRMVISGDAPEADIRAGGVPRWSQTILDALANQLRPGAGSDLPNQREGTGFVLTVAEAIALVAEHAEPVTASRWRSMVMAGEAPAPLGWEPPRWDFAVVEAWIPPALDSGVLQPLAKATSDQVPEPELFFGSTEQWVTGFLLPIYRRQLSDNGDKDTWCPEWWRHAEAVIRLEALWRSWEHLRLDGRTGMSVWLKDHLDHHLPVLTGSGGPFTNCTVSAHAEEMVVLQPFPAKAAPPQFFPDVRPPKTEATGK